MADYMPVNVTDYTIQVVQKTAPILKANVEEIVEIMYEYLFSNFPQYRQKFDMSRQADGDKKQITAVANVLIKFAQDFPNTDKLMQGLKRANKAHVDRLIKAEDYEYIGESLLYAIQTQLELQSNDVILKQWRTAYWFLANKMIEVEREIVHGEMQSILTS